MTKLLDRALKAARTLPAAEQDDIARIILRLTGADEEEPVPFTAEEQAAIAVSKTASAQAEFVTDEEVRAAWRKHGV